MKPVSIETNVAPYLAPSENVENSVPLLERPCWVVRTGDQGQFEDLILTEQLVAIGWNLPSLSEFETPRGLRTFLETTYPDEKTNKISNLVGQLQSFCWHMKPGDLLVIPFKSTPSFGIAQLIGEYWYEKGKHSQATHFRRFEWLNSEIPQILKSEVSFKSKTAISSPSAVFQMNSPDAKAEFLKLAFEKPEHLDVPLNLILYGPPGTGKTYEILTQIQPLFSAARCEWVTFHPSYSYEEFIEGLRPSSEMKFSIVPGLFKKLAERARKDPKKRYALFIDEINRGNISKIFGELITLLEPDKREGLDSAISVMLPYSQEPFSVPANLHIIGTMNSADRSISILDIALRRRFEFQEFIPDPDRIKGTSGDGAVECIEENVRIDLRKLLRSMNDRIEFLLDRDHVLGHAYFTDIKSLNALIHKFKTQILPLLQEYFYSDWEKIQLVLNDIVGVDKGPNLPQIVQHSDMLPEQLFKSALHAFSDGFESKRKYKVSSNLSAAAFRKIYE